VRACVRMCVEYENNCAGILTAPNSTSLGVTAIYVTSGEGAERTEVGLPLYMCIRT
jgi:hypothetical protein